MFWTKPLKAFHYYDAISVVVRLDWNCPSYHASSSLFKLLVALGAQEHQTRRICIECAGTSFTVSSFFGRRHQWAQIHWTRWGCNVLSSWAGKQKRHDQPRLGLSDTKLLWNAEACLPTMNQLIKRLSQTPSNLNVFQLCKVKNAKPSTPTNPSEFQMPK